MKCTLKLLLCWCVLGATWLSQAHAEFTPICGWEQQLFPSYILATASLKEANETLPEDRLGDPLGLIGVAVEAPDNNTTVKVVVESPDFFERSVFSGTLAEAGKTYQIFPKIKYRYDRLAVCDQATPASVTYRVQLGNGAEEEQTVTFTIRSVNDCPFLIEADGEQINTSFTFAAYVNEQHPFVDKLLREALDRGIVDNFTGYQSQNPKEVIRQAYALWDVLVSRDVRYSNITTTAANASSVMSQHVRLIEDSVNNSQANCVDGSVLWVSLLRKIGINAFLVLEPGHCYVGFFADRDQKLMYGVETTLLGDEVDAESLQVPRDLHQAIDEELREDWSFPSFVTAVKVASQKLQQARQQVDQGEDSGIQLIDIASARREGVLPIPFLKKSKFIAYEHSVVGTEDEDEEEEWEDEDSDEDEEEDEKE